MKSSHCQLSSWFSNSLCGNYTNSFTNCYQGSFRKTPTITILTNSKVVIFFFTLHNKYLINKFCPASQSRSKFSFFRCSYWKMCGKYSTSYPFITTKEYFSFYTYQRKNTKTSFSTTIFYTNYLKVRNV